MDAPERALHRAGGSVTALGGCCCCAHFHMAAALLHGAALHQHELTSMFIMRWRRLEAQHPSQLRFSRVQC